MTNRRRHARLVNGSFEEVKGDFTVTIQGQQFTWPAGTLDCFSPEELVAFGLSVIDEDAGPEPTDVKVLGQAIASLEGRPVLVWSTAEFTEAELEAEKAKLIAQMNREAGAYRARFVTTIPGQEGVYQAKEAEARAWSPKADMADFPFLAEEATQTGAAAADIAAGILTAAARRRRHDARIEGRRRGAAVAIAAAADLPAARAAAVVDWDAVLPA